MRLTVHPRVLLLLLLPVAVLLVVVSLGATLLGVAAPDGVPFDDYDRLMRAVSVDLESSVPSWFSASLLLLCALLLLDVARTAHLERSRGRWHWAVLTTVFFLLSMDETTSFHETGSSVVERSGIETGVRFSWVFLAIPALALFVAIMIPFLRALPRRTAGAFVLAGLVFVGGALGMEFVGSWAWDAVGQESALYAGISSVEELLEMVGAVLFAWAVADYQRRHLAAAARREADGARPGQLRGARPARAGMHVA